MYVTVRLRHWAAWLAILAMPLAYANVGLGFAAVGFRPAAFADAAYGFQLAVGQPGGSSLIRWSMIADLLGYYLMLVPLCLILWDRVRENGGQAANLFTLCGIGYLFFGAAGAAILSVVLPGQVDAYLQATEAGRLTHEGMFLTFSTAIYDGVWGTLNPLLGGVWWVGAGRLLRRKRRVLGWVTVLLGVAMLLRELKIGHVELVCLFVYFILAPIWAAWSGVDLLCSRR